MVLLYCVWAVSPASAHAIFVRSNPAPNADLAKSPAQVEIWFSEAVQPGLSAITVYDSAGLVADLGDVRVDPSDPTRMTVSLRSLADGVYTVSWKAISAIDGHFATGSFPFAVGNANANAAALSKLQQSSSSTLPASALTSSAMASADPAPRTTASAPVARQAETAKPAIRPGSWIIQVGALESEADAKTRLNEARDQARGVLGKAEPFTEAVARGDKQLYRARFAGFVDRGRAEAACKTLKRSDLPCFAMKY